MNVPRNQKFHQQPKINYTKKSIKNKKAIKIHNNNKNTGKPHNPGGQSYKKLITI